jgi:hypothetical protein
VMTFKVGLSPSLTQSASSIRIATRPRKGVSALVRCYLCTRTQ